MVYIVCVSNALAQAGKPEKAALWFAASPLGYLLLLVGLMVLWVRMERVRTHIVDRRISLRRGEF